MSIGAAGADRRGENAFSGPDTENLHERIASAICSAWNEQYAGGLRDATVPEEWSEEANAVLDALGLKPFMREGRPLLVGKRWGSTTYGMPAVPDAYEVAYRLTDDGRGSE